MFEVENKTKQDKTFEHLKMIITSLRDGPVEETTVSRKTTLNLIGLQNSVGKCSEPFLMKIDR